MKSTPRFAALALVLALICAAGSATAVAAQASITPPGEFFGHELGADRVLARWDRIVEYFELLESESDRIQVIDMGPTTLGNPFLLAVISSPENLANAERLAEVSRLLADPRGLSDQQVEGLIGEGKAVVAQTLGLHSSEVAGAQSGPAIAYDFVSRNDEEAVRILDQTVLLLFPCINPDGQIMITDWVRETVGTEHEGAGLPQLYHHYAGHDNNRDGDYLNLAESAHLAKVLYRDWKPQAYVDHHQMGSYGARMYVPPYSEPIRPGADPLQWRELSWYGAHIAYKLEEAGRTGILNAGQYPGWGHFGWHWITPYHNIAGMLTESASATLATPLYVHSDQLSGGARGWPAYEAQSNIPSLWPGGWWRVSDIVQNQRIAAWALQDHAARNRETVLRNGYLKAMRQTERGAARQAKAYVIPARQHDALTAVKLVNTLLLSDVEIHRADAPFQIDGMQYGADSYVVSMAQPKMGLVLNLLGRTRYPDNTWTRARDGSPMRPYDTATHTMAENMGVRVDPVGWVPEGEFAVLDGVVETPGSVASGSRLRLDGRANASYKAVNLLLDAGATVHRVGAAGGSLRRGDFIVSVVEGDALTEVASRTGVDFEGVNAEPGAAQPALERARLGMYQRYGGGNMDEGWTRLLLEQFAFPYASVMDEEIKAGNLNDSYDVIVLPHDSTGAIMGRMGDSPFRPSVEPPEQYRSGIGDEGVEALKEFVANGGTLVTLGRATEFAIEKFDLKVRNVVAGLSSNDFFCPGSTLRVRFDTDNPLAWGMPESGVALFWDSPAFQITPSSRNQDYERVVTYVDRDILQSGWLIGEEHLANRAAMVAAKHGDGRVVLIGIRAQHRAQSHGTYKLLFNTILR